MTSKFCTRCKTTLFIYLWIWEWLFPGIYPFTLFRVHHGCPLETLRWVQKGFLLQVMFSNCKNCVNKWWIMRFRCFFVQFVDFVMYVEIVCLIWFLRWRLLNASVPHYPHSSRDKGEGWTVKNACVKHELRLSCRPVKPGL